MRRNEEFLSDLEFSQVLGPLWSEYKVASGKIGDKLKPVEHDVRKAVISKFVHFSSALPVRALSPKDYPHPHLCFQNSADSVLTKVGRKS